MNSVAGFPATNWFRERFIGHLCVILVGRQLLRFRFAQRWAAMCLSMARDLVALHLAPGHPDEPRRPTDLQHWSAGRSNLARSAVFVLRACRNRRCRVGHLVVCIGWVFRIGCVFGLAAGRAMNHLFAAREVFVGLNRRFQLSSPSPR